MTELVFDCTGARPDRYAVTPAMNLMLRISETSGESVEAIALRCQIRIEPARRKYTPAEAERLNDLFGETERWAETLRPVQFTQVAVMVPRFTGSTEIELPVPLSYDLEIGATRYFAGLDGGEVPWSKEAAYRLPVSLWREAVDAHFPNSAWIRMSRPVMDELLRYKSRRALPTWDATIESLLAETADRSGTE